MNIRRMRAEDIAEVSSVVIDSFLYSVAGDHSDQGIATFMKIASAHELEMRMGEDNTMLVCESGEGICGYVEVKEGRHIAMLFVHPAKQTMGVGSKLIEEALRHCTSELVTVSASLTAVGAYLQFGFEIAGPEDQSQGLSFRPMIRKSGFELEPKP